MEFAVFEVYVHNFLNQYAANDYKRARAAGFKRIDFYHYPSNKQDPR